MAYLPGFNWQRIPGDDALNRNFDAIERQFRLIAGALGSVPLPFEHHQLQGLLDDDHTQYLKEKASGGLASETPEHAHQATASCGILDHGLALTGLGDDDHVGYLLANGGRDLTGWTATLKALDIQVKKPWFDIRAYDADPSLADNAPKIQAALTAAKNAGGGRVLVPSGTFLTGNIDMDASYVNLVGLGEASILKLKDGANTNLITVSHAGVQSSIQSLRLDGNKTNNSAGHGIYISGAAYVCSVRDVYITQCKQSGIYKPSAASGVGWEFFRVRINYCDDHGVYIEGGFDHKFILCVMLLNAKHGIFQPSTAGGMIQFIGCRPNANGTIDNSSYYNAYLQGSQTTWIGCFFDNSRWHGAVVEGNNHVFVGGRFGSAGYESTGGTPSGLKITGNGNRVIANDMQWNDGYALELDAAAINNLIMGNDFRNNGVGPNDLTETTRSNNIICHNVGDGEPEITFGTAAPTGGTWSRGSICYNTTPSAEGAPGWICTTAGTPGTWKAMANLAS